MTRDDKINGNSEDDLHDLIRLLCTRKGFLVHKIHLPRHLK